MRTCNAPIIEGACPGHLGKFDDCVAEALWEWSSFGDTDETTGDSDFDGHLALVVIEEDSDARIDMDSPDSRLVRVPAGFYIVHTASSGAVSVWTYDTGEAARKEFAAHDARYVLWLNNCDPNNPDAHEGCREADECQIVW